jgi:hypothetical protein
VLVAKQPLTNVDVILSQPGDLKLTAGSLDAALFVNAYDEVEPYREMLGHVLEALTGRLHRKRQSIPSGQAPPFVMQ